ncbi:Adenine nucleotide alpha hydrolases-like superfamily protein [Rhynchospora pubera]|uniref:Adenine nucleotide alpha hydrolases-like superfamily protein n=1 Tax=Rhynchospora pubera TaxID=906938 RepID=A0AAV8CCK8_9POAL|nr:Adenine nucleotide alpha hydrolases-like superfamily protein [Rhynchospora pubera]
MSASGSSRGEHIVAEFDTENVEKGLFHQAKEGKITMVLAFDDSEHSFYALEWTLNHFYSPATGGGMGFQLVIVHAKRAMAAANVSGPGTSAEEVLQDAEMDQRKLAARTVEKARAVCSAHSVEAVVEIMEGDAKHVLMEAVAKHHADILILGSHGYNSVQRAFMGSVSDHMAHHAQCSVMIVKRPKPQKGTKKQTH